jgi:hypothetical protein
MLLELFQAAGRHLEIAGQALQAIFLHMRPGVAIAFGRKPATGKVYVRNGRVRFARLAIPHVCGCFFGISRNDKPQTRKQNTQREQPGNNFSFEHLFTPLISGI